MFTRSVAVLGSSSNLAKVQRNRRSISESLDPQLRDAIFDPPYPIPDEDFPVVKLNVSGRKVEYPADFFLKYPRSRLGRIAILMCKREDENANIQHINTLCNRICDAYRDDCDEFYFERSFFTFESIIDIFRYGGGVHFPPKICPNLFFDELGYWLFGRTSISRCCIARYDLAFDDSVGNEALKVSLQQEKARKRSSNPRKLPEVLRTLHEEKDVDVTENGKANHIGPVNFELLKKPSDNDGRGDTGIDDIDLSIEPHKLCCGKNRCLGHRYSKTRRATWQLLENPMDSLAATIFAFVSFCLVVLTVVLLILSSVPDYQVPVVTGVFDTGDNRTEMVAIREIEQADLVCLGWFTFEHILRVWASPNRAAYLISPFAIIDFLSIFPYYVELVTEWVGLQSHIFGELKRSFMMIRILRGLRIARVLRVLKIARYSRGFQTVGSTFKRCWRESIMLVLFMLTTNAIFATVMYYIEHEQNPNHFPSIPGAAWWCIITMTTVGYGDVYPKTVLGKLFAALVCVTGIILLAFPISVIVENFQREYKRDRIAALLESRRSFLSRLSFSGRNTSVANTIQAHSRL